MPLAIELAAARVESLGVEQLLERLGDRFGLLGSTDRMASARHQSLSAAVDWSYQLLSHEERRIFRWLSAFPGWFTLEAAEAVTGSAAISAVLRLVDCSLLSPPRAGPDGRVRYVMLETLRAYGADRLAHEGDYPEVADALVRYSIGVAEQAMVELEASPSELAAVRWLDAENLTVSQALTWAQQHDMAAALRLAVALAAWWQLRGRTVTGYALLQAAAREAPEGSDTYNAAQLWLGHLAYGTHDNAAALGHYEAVLGSSAAGRAPRLRIGALLGDQRC